MKPRSWKAWSIVHVSNPYLWTGCTKDRRPQSIAAFCVGRYTWKQWYARGYRCIRVRIVIDKPKRKP